MFVLHDPTAPNGSMLNISYGACSNENLMMQYGFSIRGNVQNSIDVGELQAGLLSHKRVSDALALRGSSEQVRRCAGLMLIAIIRACKLFT